jgi:ribosomal protein S12 methylthiotransferase accessory factor
MSENSPLAALAGLFGAVGAVHAVRTNGWLPDRCSMYSAAVGNIKAIRSDFAAGVPMPYGTGRAYDDPAHARLVAISEAMERYSALVFGHRQLVSASAQELGQDALDLETVPRCSARELRRPGCPLVPADGAADIRWVAATDLTTGRDIFLPAVMVDLGCRRRASERFWLPISTGCATHVTVEAALVNAICELIERDAIALTWLQKLPLPLLDEKFHGIPVREMTQWCADRGIDTYLFDATTDIGVPTVYCVQLADAEYPAAQVVGCATDLDATAAAERALLEAMGMRGHLHAEPAVPRRYSEYTAASDGATAMARRSRRSAFAFLFENLANRAVSGPGQVCLASHAERLAYLVRRLAEKGMTAYAVEISSRELTSIDHSAVRVVIPDLQPMSLRPLAQYRGHPRLYRAPAQMGMRVLAESQLNPWPQPVS